MISLLYVALGIVLVFVLFGCLDVLATRRSRVFAGRHNLHSTRGSIDRAAPLAGTIAGASVQIEPERRMVPRGGNSIRMAFLVETNTREIAILKRYRGRFVEMSQASAPSGMKRGELPASLVNEFELWIPTGSRAKGLKVLEQEAIASLLCGFWALHEVQWLGGQLVVRVNGDTSNTEAAERAWSLTERLLEREHTK